MSSIFRSENMHLCQLYLQPDAAYSCVAELGELAIVQFRDLNPNVNSFQRKFVDEVRRCEEMERKIRFLESEMKQDDIPICDTKMIPEAPKPREIIELETFLEKLDREIKEINTNADALMKNFNELTELKYSLSLTQSFFQYGSTNAIDALQDIVQQEHESNEQFLPKTTQPMQLGYISGVIATQRVPSFERMLWRACRGNVVLRQIPIPELIEDPNTGEQIHKTVFIIYFQGEQLKNRVQKICEGYRANVYPSPENPDERHQLTLDVMTRLEDLIVILRQTKDQRRQILLNTSRIIRTWKIKVIKVKSIYHTMNMFNNDIARKCFIAECWAPTLEIDHIRLALRKGSEMSGSGPVSSILSQIPTDENPPTYHKLNKFTQGFQNLVDAYGVANYREINPMPFLLITFPFLFAVMFGDAGHGIIVTLFALWMVIKEKSLKDKWKTQEVWTIFFGGRYIILLMGLFSIYTGIIYNDFFSKSINIFKSSWIVGFDYDFLLKSSGSVTLEPNPTPYNTTKTFVKMYSGSPYVLGIDPIWQLADNKITFTNSIKMKFAVIIGITQMTFGLFLGLWNHLYFKHYYAVFLEFIPQLLFLTCIFIYLIILIFYKWTHFQGKDATDAPSLLIHLINMMLLSYPDSPQSSQTFYKSQKALQTALLFIGLLCIPWMFLGKPIYMIIQRRSKSNKSLGTQKATATATATATAASSIVTNEGRTDDIEMANRTQHDEVEMSEVWVEQGIHTIEYFLGCISHTASYLRLWALSLAHAQLSEVLWRMVFQIGLSMNMIFLGGIAMFIVFMPWSNLTIFILLLMEGLSAFLHALRLHWVEFQSKFYKGEGYQFLPFSFKIILDETLLSDN